jgi:hypothetical protein
MFLNTTSKTSRLIAGGFDRAIDFATLGEYRVVVDEPAAAVDADDLWFADVEWSAPVRSREASCVLPRSHDRVASRDFVAG